MLAGVTVAAYLVPQVMAYAEVAGLPPEAGLWAVIGPLAVYALLGSSKLLSVGPESTTALMTAVALGPLAAGDPGRYGALAAVLALLVGGLCLLAGSARLGVLADLLSKPVLTGYLAGIAVLMIVSQLGKLTGVPVTGDGMVAEFRSFFSEIGHLHWPTLLLGGFVLACLLAFQRWLPRFPGPLAAMLVAAAVVTGFSLTEKGIRVIGPVPDSPPVPGVPALNGADLATLLLPAVGIALVGFSDNVLTARAFAGRYGEQVDSNRELRALAASNLSSGLLHGFPVSSSASRTALASAMGARTQLYSLTALVTVVLTVLFAGPLLAGFPKAALAAIVVYAALKLIDPREFRRIARFRRSELVLAISTLLAVVGLGVLYGVLAAVGLSVLDLLRRLARPHGAVLGFVPGVPGMHDVGDYPDATTEPGLVIYRYDAPLCFANADDFRRRALAALDGEKQVEWFVLNAEANVELDITAADALRGICEELRRRGITFALARVKQELREDLEAAGLLRLIGSRSLYPTLPSVVDAFRQRRKAHA
ncbi:Putative sulfate-transport transmembrane protein ABC transporter [Amycolatopsis decaplanina DSM 44594]|uniref:Putative sulfate-transport transmembrane protein ABC transporter n=1 Tax=Amycolatopsis decaplanina DSM 44594 TaxID=1284240 RepID=M2Y0R9_9PSEU|nr:Putative sulfate-transport transmembrane protein ABC transporter [Amycolatopsis decaplanina DSM 44594]